MRFLTRQKVSPYRLMLLFIGSCLCCMLLPIQARAATGTIADDAHVLDIAAIQQYTDPFSYTVDIFTTKAFQGSNDDFDASVKGLTSDEATPAVSPCDPRYQVGCQLFNTFTMPGVSSPDDSSISTPAATSTVDSNNPAPAATSTADSSASTSFSVRQSDASQSVEIGIDVPTRHLAIYSGASVTIPQDNYNNAIQTFANTMHQTHDNYTQATIAALKTLESATDRFWHDNGRGLLIALLIVLLIVSAIVMLNKYGQGPSSGDDNDNDSNRNYRQRNYYHNNYTPWNSGTSGSGGGWNSGGSGTSNGSGGGGGGASGNF